MAEKTPRLGITKIEASQTPAVAADVNGVLGELDDSLTHDLRVTTLPAPGVPGRRASKVTQTTPVEIVSTWIDTGSEWKLVYPPADESISSSNIIGSNLNLFNKINPKVTWIPPEAFDAHVTPVSPQGIMWYKDYAGFVHLEGAVKFSSAWYFIDFMEMIARGFSGVLPPDPGATSGLARFTSQQKLVANRNVSFAFYNELHAYGITIDNGALNTPIGLGVINYYSPGF